MGTKVSALTAITDPTGGSIYIVDSGTASKKITVANLLAETGTISGDSIEADSGALSVITTDANGYISSEDGKVFVYGYVIFTGVAARTGYFINLPVTVGGTSGGRFVGSCTLEADTGSATIANAGGLVCVAIEGGTTAYIYRQATAGLEKIDYTDHAGHGAKITFSLEYEAA